MIPYLIAGAGLLVGKSVGKSSAEKESGEKLDLLKKLAELTPEQSAAVDAVSKMTVEEARERVKHGVGPFGPLPATASARAQQVRDARVSGVTITPEEKAAVLGAPDRQAAIKNLVDRKVLDVRSSQGTVPGIEIPV